MVSSIGKAIGGAIGGAINGLLTNPSGVQSAISQVKMQANMVSQIQEAAQKTVAAVNGAWIGGDSEAYQAAINRRSWGWEPT
jgi:uncharacterized protein YukE